MTATETKKLVYKGRYALLDEHSLPPTSKHPGITVDARRLQQIADNNNKRVRDTGDATPLILGHTDDEAYEIEQPIIVGFADNFSVSPLFDTGRQAIWADFHFYEDKLDEARNYPRRSVELWASKNLIDPISLLSASTPERDLGLMKFSVNTSETPYHYSLTEEETMNPEPEKTPKTDVDPNVIQAALSAFMQTPLVKQLEELVDKLSNMSDEDEEGEEGVEGMPPEEKAMPDKDKGKPMPPEDKREEAAKFNEPAPVKFENAGGAMPSGTNTYVPSTNKNSDKKDYSMSAELKLKYEAIEQDMQDAHAKIQALETLNKKLSQHAREEHAARQWEALKSEGYELDDTDLKFMSALQIENQKVHADTVIRRKYRKAPVKSTVNDLIQYSRTGEETVLTQDATLKIAEWAVENNILDFEEAKAKYSAATASK